jgi:hypothetical protein
MTLRNSVVGIAVVALFGAIVWFVLDRSVQPTDARNRDRHVSDPTTAGSLHIPSAMPAVTTLNPNEILFSLPTLCDSLPPLDSTLGSSVSSESTVIDEDDWRQVEFVARNDRATVDRELGDLARFKVEKRVGVGWKDVFVRRSRPEAIRSLAIRSADLFRTAGAKSFTKLYLRSGGVVSQVRGGFAVPLRGGVLYGHTDNDRLASLGVAGQAPGRLDGAETRAIADICHAFGLFVVDWYRVEVIAH